MKRKLKNNSGAHAVIVVPGTLKDVNAITKRAKLDRIEDSEIIPTFEELGAQKRVRLLFFCTG
jgi:hypothetical protein